MPAHEIGVALAALIFLRWADFEEAEREAIAAFDDVNYEPVLPSRFYWRSWCNVYPSELERIIRELPSVLDRASNSRHDSMATQLHRVAPAVEKLSRIPAETLALIIRWLADQPFETLQTGLRCATYSTSCCENQGTDGLGNSLHQYSSPN